ncbi:hypothetical protein LUX73_42865 [Actinomadura madurae]|nr:hypothetical protein [Actinomadura madurae]MCQ0010778.1 hypothetical protein [Actinomadura madurae]
MKMRLAVQPAMAMDSGRQKSSQLISVRRRSTKASMASRKSPSSPTMMNRSTSRGKDSAFQPRRPCSRAQW